MSPIFFCSCCGAEVTAPQFHNGKVYGWTCIMKVKPGAKQTKTKWLLLENAKITAMKQSPLMAAMGRTQELVTGEYKSNSGKVFNVKIALISQDYYKDADGIVWVLEKRIFPKRMVGM